MPKKIKYLIMAVTLIWPFLLNITEADFPKALESLKKKEILSENFQVKTFRPNLALRYEQGFEWILKSAGLPSDTSVSNFEAILGRKTPETFKMIAKFDRDLFYELLLRVHNVIPKKEDFLDPRLLSRNNDNPFLAYADMLNLKVKSDFIKRGQAVEIINQFLEQKPYLLDDGLYGKFFTHEHYRVKGAMEDYLQIAGALGVQKSIFLGTGMNPDNTGYEKHQAALLEVQKQYADKIIAFCTIDEEDDNAQQIIEDCVKKGGKGLKLLGWHPEFYDEEFNSPRMMRVYEKARELKLPVLFHGSVMNIPGLEDQIDEVVGKFPDVTFVHAHYCSTVFNGINLDRCAKLLDNHPNLFIDITMGGGLPRYLKYFENSEDLKQVRDFLIKYQDRIMASVDIILASKDNKDKLYNRMVCTTRVLSQESFQCPIEEPEKVRQGLNLPLDVLRKLYYENPKRIYGM